MNIFKIFSVIVMSSCLYAIDDVKQKEAEINKIEQDLRTKVSEYNKMIAEKQSGKQKNDSEIKTEDSSKKQKEEKTTSSSSLAISSDPNILQEQVKQLQNTVENLTKEVKDLKDNVILKKKGEVKESTKKATENDTNIIEYTSSQAQFNAANVWFEKGTEEGYKKAIELFEQIAKENCDHSIAFSAYNKIGDAYRKLAKWDESTKYYNLVIEQDHAKIYQRVDAFLGKSDAEREKNDRISACKTLDALERSNLPMTQQQKNWYQELIVKSDCASKKDHDIKEEKNGDQ